MCIKKRQALFSLTQFSILFLAVYHFMWHVIYFLCYENPEASKIRCYIATMALAFTSLIWHTVFIENLEVLVHSHPPFEEFL